MSEREEFSTFLFDRNDKTVCNIKFMRGHSPQLTDEQLCHAAHEVIEKFWAAPAVSIMPAENDIQLESSEIVAAL